MEFWRIGSITTERLKRHHEKQITIAIRFDMQRRWLSLQRILDTVSNAFCSKFFVFVQPIPTVKVDGSTFPFWRNVNQYRHHSIPSVPSRHRLPFLRQCPPWGSLTHTLPGAAVA